MSEAWQTPAIVVGVLGLGLQGAKAGMDLFTTWSARKRDNIQRELARAIALIQLIDGLPIEAGEKARLKLVVVRERLPFQLEGEVGAALKALSGDRHAAPTRP